MLLNTKNYYFVPFSQDAPLAKPNSLVFHHDLVVDALVAAFNGKQLQPVLRSKRHMKKHVRCSV